MTIQQQFGQRVRYLRKEQDISQEELARLSKINRSYMGTIERGQGNVGLQLVQRIAIALKIPIAVLFEFSEGTAEIKI